MANFDDERKAFQEAQDPADRMQSALFQHYARNRTGAGTVRTGNEQYKNPFGDAFPQFPDDVKAALESTYNEAAAQINNILKAAEDFKKNPASLPNKAAEFQALNQQTADYKGPPIHTGHSGPYVDLGSVKSAVRGWQDKYDKLDKAEARPAAAPPSLAPAAQKPPETVYTPWAQPTPTGMTEAQKAALEQFNDIKAKGYKAGDMDWSALKTAAELYVQEFSDFKFHDNQTPDADKVKGILENLEKNESKGRVNDINDLLGRDALYTPEEMRNVAEYAGIAIEKQTTWERTVARQAEQAQARKTEDLYPYRRILEEQRNPEPRPVDLDDPRSVLKAIFDKKVTPEILNRGIETLNGLAAEIPHSVMTQTATDELKSLLNRAKDMSDVKNRAAAYTELAHGILDGKFAPYRDTPSNAEAAVKLLTASAEMGNIDAIATIGIAAKTGLIKTGDHETSLIKLGVRPTLLNQNDSMAQEYWQRLQLSLEDLGVQFNIASGVNESLATFNNKIGSLKELMNAEERNLSGVPSPADIQSGFSNLTQHRF